MGILKKIITYLKPTKEQLPVVSKGLVDVSTGPVEIIPHHQVPEDVFDLLWFKNGPFASDYYYDCGEYFDEEPSLIDVTLPVKPGVNDIKIGYYPSYTKLSPIQRYEYINWLKNVDSDTDISYVFVFYYGLERYIFTENYERSVAMMFKLLNRFGDNKSFRFYCTNALIIASVVHQRIDWIQMIDDDFLDPIKLATVKAMLLKKFYPEDIIKFSKIVGWTNDRYIKNNYDLFFGFLEQNLNQTFGTNFYPIDLSDCKKYDKTNNLMLANYSLSQEMRNVKMLDVLENKRIQKDLYGLLEKTHEDTKIKLRNDRKKVK